MNKNEPAIQAGQMDCISLEIGPHDFITCEEAVVICQEPGFRMKSVAGDKAGKTGVVDKAVQYCRLHMPGAAGAKKSFFNVEAGRRKLVLAAPYPCKISSIDLDPNGGTVLCQKKILAVFFQGYLPGGCRVADKCCRTSLQGAGHLMSRISGCGKAYLKTSGSFVERTLQAGEVLRVAVCSIAALQSTLYSISISIKR